jgi:hypothetical protein
MWDWAIWAALVLGALAGIAALTLLFMRVREALRALRNTRRDVVGRLDELAASAGATADKVGAAGDTAELQQSLGRLRVSLARLAVLRGALDEADDTFGRVFAIVPRK